MDMRVALYTRLSQGPSCLALTRAIEDFPAFCSVRVYTVYSEQRLQFDVTGYYTHTQQKAGIFTMAGFKAMQRGP